MRSRMVRSSLLFLATGFLFVATLPKSSEARVVRFVVEQRRSFASGATWGPSGPYERLDGTAYMEVDPRDPLNAIIVNLDRAPKNKSGMVEFSSPFFILKPVDMTRGNHKLFYGINNRGNKVEMLFRIFPGSPSAATNNNDPLTAADVGDGLLLRLGYAIVDAGWQGDVVPLNKQLVPKFPVATQADGSPIVGAVRIEYSDRAIPQAGTFTLTLEGSPGFRSYETADMNTAHSTLTVRSRSMGGQKVAIPSGRWAFGRCPAGPATLVPTTTDICLFDGFQANNLYELIYPAKNPMVMGLGYAVTRDVGSFLRYQTHDDAGNPNPLALSSTQVGIRRAYSSGTSSTGMYQRDWLYLGFNEDEAHRKVFDAVTIYTAGTLKLFANVEFADPNTWSEQDSRSDFLSTSYPPFTFAVTTDPISGIHDGILKRPATDPLVFQLDGGHEVWDWRGSLNVADSLGHPIRLPDNVRLYFNNSFQHIGIAGLLSPPAPRDQFGPTCQQLTFYEVNTANGAGPSPSLRALTIALDAWADQGIEPPKSNYPGLEDGTLVTLDEARARFPAIPGVNFPTVMNDLYLWNFGPEFSSVGGRMTVLPPLLGPRYQLLVPRPDADGVDAAGIRPMQIRVPLGTNMGVNLRAPGSREGDHCFVLGSFIPFATTKAERLANGDPRKSLQERYKSHAGFVKAVAKAGQELVHEKFLLQEDANTFIQAAQASDVLRGVCAGSGDDDGDCGGDDDGN